MSSWHLTMFFIWKPFSGSVCMWALLAYKSEKLIILYLKCHKKQKEQKEFQCKLPSTLKTSTFGGGFTSMLQSVCAFLKQDRVLRQPVRVFSKTENNKAPGAEQFLLSLSLCCWHSWPTFLLLLLFLYPTAHTLIHSSPLVIPCLQCAASINTPLSFFVHFSCAIS